MWCVTAFLFDFLKVSNGGIDVPVIRGLCADIEQLRFAKPTSTTSNIATGQVGISFFLTI